MMVTDKRRAVGTSGGGFCSRVLGVEHCHTSVALFSRFPNWLCLLEEAYVVKRSHFIEEETEGREGPGRAQGHIGDKDPPLILHMAQACSLLLDEAAGGAAPKSQGLHPDLLTSTVRDSVLAWAPTPVALYKASLMKKRAFSGDFSQQNLHPYFELHPAQHTQCGEGGWNRGHTGSPTQRDAGPKDQIVLHLSTGFSPQNPTCLPEPGL